MRSSLGWVLLALATSVLGWPAPARCQSRAPGTYKLAPDSPLATDGVSIYGVADDRRTLLISSGGASDWTVLAVKPAPRRISGLAWSRGILYVADDLSNAVLRLRGAAQENAQFQYNRPPTVVSAEILHQGPPLQRPRDLACTGQAVLVADPGAATVFQISPYDRKPVPLVTGLPPGEIHVAADRSSIVVASPGAGEVRQPAPFEGGFAQKSMSPFEFAVWRTRTPGSDPAGAGTGPAGSVAQRLPPAIQRPAAPTLARGSLYLLDSESGTAYVTFRQQARPTRVVPTTPVKRPTRLLTLGESLLVLDADRGALVRWPLPVPTEIDLGRDAPTALEAVYRYLFERRALPTQRVAWRGSLEATLRQAGAWEGSPSGPLASALCTLNAPVCAQGQWRPPAAAPTILVPDVPIERVLDLATMEVEELGDRTLGEEVDRLVVTPVFHDHRAGTQLWELNASRLSALDRGSASSKQRWGPYDASRIRNLRRGDFPPGFSLTVPTEKVRALVALPRSLLREEGLSEIRLVSPGFNWVPLEETEAKASAMQPPPGPAPEPSPVPCDMALLKRQHAELLKTIRYKLPPNLGPVTVGVVEENGIDVQHPAFGGSDQAFTYISTPPAPAPLVTDPPLCKEKVPLDDHGTGVAGLIASRVPELEGLAPDAQIVPLRTTDEFVGEDLKLAFNNRRVRIFNFSAHYEKKLVTNIRQKINELKEALFVVAAGNDATDTKPVCDSAYPYPAYPVCEGYRPNVLVVAATNADGIALIEKTTSPRAPGSNWNDKLVHIAAPGTGYHSLARGNSYVPVRGTSFAAPLVTATAALLYAQGVTDPFLIKQRIIATADQRDSLLTKVYGAGLLNVERAVTAPLHAVLGTATPAKIVALKSDDISIKWSGGSRTLSLANVRRLTKSTSGQSYRIIYLDDVTGSLVIQPEVDPGPWPFKYQNVNAAGFPTGAVISDQLESYPDYVGPIR